MSFIPNRRVGKVVLSAFTALFVLAVLSGAVLAQTETGQITINVTDPTGAVVPNAAVVVKAANTGAMRNVTTSDEGSVTVTNLQPGTYEVTTTATGFAPLPQKVDVTVGGKVTLDAKLSVAAIGGESVTVTAGEGGVAVNTQSQEISNVVSGTQIRELPSLTRNPYDFVALSGTVASDPGGSTGRGVGVAINGQRAASTNILLDGGENVDTFGAGIGQTVPLDSVSEFRVITNNFTAEYGRASGGIVNVGTRSGTNEYHGTAYEFNRISRLASNSFDNNANGLPKPRFTRNQFGYSLGGPLNLPRFGEGGPSVYHGKDKLFFFSSTEWTRVRSIENKITVVPTPQLIAASNANTRAFFAAFPLATPINGPVSTVSQVCPAGNCGAFSALPGNLPAFGQVRFSVPSDVGAGSPQNSYQTVARVDYNYSDKTQIYGRYALDSNDFFAGTNNFSPYAGFSTGSTNFNNNMLLNMTHTFTSRLTTQVKGVFNRLNNLQPLGSQPVGPTLYLTGTANQQLAGQLLAFPGYSAFSPGNAIPFGGPQNLTQLYSDTNYTMGKHQFRFGGTYIYLRDNRAFGAYQEATEQLGSNVRTGLSNFVNGNLTLFSAAVFPQGKFPGQTLTLPVGPPDFTRSNRYNDYALYAQDSWRIRPRFTLNLGVRYEYFGVQHNKHPEKDSNFYLGSGSTLQERIRNGSVQIAKDSPVGGLWKPDRNNFAPRLGFAWDIFGDGKTSLRGGYGIAYERNFGNVTFNVIQNPPNYAVISLNPADVGGTIPVTLNNSGPLAGSSGTKLFPRSSLRYVREDIRTAYSHLYSVSLERQIFANTVASVEYSGSKGVDLYSIENINRQGTGLRFLNSNAPVPAGFSASTRLNGQFSNINTRGNNGKSRYDALIVGLESSNFRKLGLQMTARYTLAKAKDNLSSTFSESSNNFNLGLLDPFNPDLDYGYADFDIRHRFSGSFNWELPFARDSHGLKRALLGGVTLTGIFSARTGTPFTVFDCSQANLTTCIRVELNGPVKFRGNGTGPDAGSANRFKYIDLSGLSASTFVDPFSGGTEVGPFPADMSRRNAFRGPGFWNFDGGVYKTFHITEKYSMQLRGEFYNVFNHANTFVSSSEADLSAQDYIPAFKNGRRNIQLALKFIF